MAADAMPLYCTVYMWDVIEQQAIKSALDDIEFVYDDFFAIYHDSFN